MKPLFLDDSVILTDLDSFDIEMILECGQCFRFEKLDKWHYRLFAFNSVLEVKQDKERVILSPCTKEAFENIWFNYFDLGRDYGLIKKKLSRNDKVMREAVRYGSGIRILKQDSYESLISFIISQNNNIPRIKKILGAICCELGERKQECFPCANSLSEVSEEEFFALRMGFRAKYMVDAIDKLYSGKISFEDLKNKDTDYIRNELIKIKGVGRKVADCTLLFGFNRLEVFPIDVWVQRVMEKYYFNGKEVRKEEIQEFARNKWGEYAGIAQQYLFYYERENEKVRK